MIAYLGPDEEASDPFKWLAIFNGPKNSPFEGGTFKLSIVMTEEYPHRPPRVECLTPVYHPNIASGGGIRG